MVLCAYMTPTVSQKKQFFLCHLILSEETTEHGRTPACIKKTIQALLKFLSTYSIVSIFEHPVQQGKYIYELFSNVSTIYFYIPSSKQQNVSGREP